MIMAEQLVIGIYHLSCIKWSDSSKMSFYNRIQTPQT